MASVYQYQTVDESSSSINRLETISMFTNNSSITIIATLTTFKRELPVTSHTTTTTMRVRKVSNSLDMKIISRQYDTEFGELVDEVVEEDSGDEDS